MKYQRKRDRKPEIPAQMEPAALTEQTVEPVSGAEPADLGQAVQDGEARASCDNCAAGAAAVPEAGGHAQAVVQRMMREARQLQAVLPDFDLGQALQEPRFVRLVAAGLPVSEAYLAANSDRFLRRAFDLGLRQGDRQARQQANQARPPENGSAPGGVVTALDPAKLSRSQRKQIRQRVRRGERVTF